MMVRVLAWAAVVLVVWLAAKAVNSWQNPWAAPAAPAAVSLLPVSPVLSNLPASGPGCGKDCRYD